MTDTKESIFKEWEERSHRNEQQNAREEVEEALDQIDTWLSHLEPVGTERSEGYKLHEEDKEAIQDYLQYIRELIQRI